MVPSVTRSRSRALLCLGWGGGSQRVPTQPSRLPAGQHVCPLSRRAYILDVASEMEQVEGGYMLWFRRLLWDQPLKFENELYVTLHYNQVSTGATPRPGTSWAPRGCELRLFGASAVIGPR